MTVDEVVDRFRSVSHVAVLDADAQATRCSTRCGPRSPRTPTPPGRDRIQIPYRVDAYWCEKA